MRKSRCRSLIKLQTERQPIPFPYSKEVDMPVVEVNEIRQILHVDAC